MAQNTWINITADKGTRTDHTHDVHEAKGGTAASGDLTISFDSAVITSLGTFDTAVATARLRAIAGGLK